MFGVISLVSAVKRPAGAARKGEKRKERINHVDIAKEARKLPSRTLQAKCNQLKCS